MDALISHDWPGNVRELRNLVERMMILTRGERIEAADVPIDPSTRVPRDGLFDHRTFQSFKDEAERQFLARKLAENNGNVSKTARDLDMQRSNLYKKIEKYNLDRDPDERVAEDEAR
jgi:two-component system nitrogen regulation response regulator NtrX